MTLKAKMELLPKKKNKLSYFRQVQKEFKKITWTSRKELILSTKVVLMSIFLFGIAIYVADVVIHFGFKMINNMAQLIIG